VTNNKESNKQLTSKQVGKVAGNNEQLTMYNIQLPIKQGCKQQVRGIKLPIDLIHLISNEYPIPINKKSQL